MREFRCRVLYNWKWRCPLKSNRLTTFTNLLFRNTGWAHGVTKIMKVNQFALPLKSFIILIWKFHDTDIKFMNTKFLPNCFIGFRISSRSNGQKLFREMTMHRCRERHQFEFFSSDSLASNFVFHLRRSGSATGFFSIGHSFSSRIFPYMRGFLAILTIFGIQLNS